MGIRWRVIVPALVFLSCATTDSTGGDIKTKLVIIGASYARGWTDFSPANFTVVNKGVNGEQSSEMLARFRKDVIDERPEVVIIWGFINDIFRSNREGIEPTMVRTRKSITEMVELAKANGIKPIIATEVTIRGRSGIKETVASWIGRIKGGESYQDYVNRHVLRTNQWIREYAHEQRIQVLDFQPLLSDGEGRRKPEYATDDGSHLSAKAYSRLSQYAVEKMN